MDPKFAISGVARGTGSLARHTVGVSSALPLNHPSLDIVSSQLLFHTFRALPIALLY